MAPPGSKKIKVTAIHSVTLKKVAKPRDDFEESFYDDVSSNDSDENVSQAPGVKRKRTTQALVAHASYIKKARKAVCGNDLASDASTLSDHDNDPEENPGSFLREPTRSSSVSRRTLHPFPHDIQSDSSNTSLFAFHTAVKAAEEKPTATDQTATSKTIIRFNISELFSHTKMLGICSTADVVGEIASDGQLRVLDRAHKNGTVATATIPKLDCLPEAVLLKIYRLLFVSDRPISFTGYGDLDRSAAFLRVCHKFHVEGAPILYGENSFHLARRHAARGKYWEKEWTEIGYKDVRRFMIEIGMPNVNHLKYVSMELDDATPSLSATWTEFQRRFVNDAVLLHLLQFIGENCSLDKFGVELNNRKTIDTNDYAFLKRMSSIKCHEFYVHPSVTRTRMLHGIEDKLRALMEVPGPGNVERSKKKTPKMMYQRPRV